MELRLGNESKRVKRTSIALVINKNEIFLRYSITVVVKLLLRVTIYSEWKQFMMLHAKVDIKLGRILLSLQYSFRFITFKFLFISDPSFNYSWVNSQILFSKNSSVNKEMHSPSWLALFCHHPCHMLIKLSFITLFRTMNT